MNRVQVEFSRTRDRLVGGCVLDCRARLVVTLEISIRKSIWAQRQRLSGVSCEMSAKRILIATSNPGKLRDFAGAAASHDVTVAGLPNFRSLPPVVEDGKTFEENARKKAEQYSLAAPGEIVLADDSGLEIDALQAAPGVHSARYAAENPQEAGPNTDDDANNARVLRELQGVPAEKRTARFVCVIVAARDGRGAGHVSRRCRGRDS